jgi:moderate conductance mechanosensitive channel
MQKNIDIITYFWSTTYGIIFASLVLIVCGVAYLKRVEAKRLNFLKKADLSHAVETNHPDDDIDSIMRSRGTQSIVGRFYTIRWVFTSLIICLAILLLALSNLPSISAAYLTLLVAVFAVLAGIAAKPFIENFFAGLVITFSQPIRIGDTVIIDGHYGTVEKITMFFSIIKLWNWQRFVLPNHKIVEKEILNLSLSDEYEWAHVSFWVSPLADIEKVKTIAKTEMARSQYHLKKEPPSFWTIDLDKDAIQCWVAGWVETSAHAWALKTETRKRLVKEFKKEGIDFHVHNAKLENSKRSVSSMHEHSNAINNN